MKYLIALLGRNGAGKETVVKALAKTLIASHVQFEVVSSSEIIAQKVRQLGRVPDRRNCQLFVALMENNEGPGALSREMFKVVNVAFKNADVVIFDAVRMPADMEAVLKMKHRIIFHPFADSKIRWKRCRKRNMKPGEASMPYAVFKRQDRGLTENSISKLAMHPEVIHIDNNYSLCNLVNNVEFHCVRLLRPILVRARRK